MSPVAHAAPPQRRLCLLGLAGVLVVGCGGDDVGGMADGALFPDGRTGDGGAGDCHAERDDLGNGAVAEATGLGYGGARIAICGSVDDGHAGGSVVDVDRYQVTVAEGGPVVVRLTALLGGQLARLELIVRDADETLVTVARFRAGHAVTALVLPSGAYTLAVEAGGTPVAADVPYRVEVYADQPDLRCPAVTSPATHTELDEIAAGHRRNDVLDVWQLPTLRAALTSGADTADEISRAVSANGRIAIAGLSAAVTTTGDDYRDRDTFALYTGATTNQLDLRAVWPGDGNDLDLLVFEANTVTEPMGTPTRALVGDELLLTAVRPSTQYWLWIGGSRRSTALPASYVVHVCGREIAPAPAAR